MQAESEVEALTMSRSVLRHRPIEENKARRPVQIPRASRVKRKAEPYLPDDQAYGRKTIASPSRRAPRTALLWWMYLVLGMGIALALLWLGQRLMHFVQTSADDLRYGRPRTTHIDHFVGHEKGEMPSHFVAMNLDGAVYIIEMPGGSPENARLLVGPRLIGEGAELAPVTLSFVGEKAHPDLLVEVHGIQTRFRNTGSAYASASGETGSLLARVRVRDVSCSDPPLNGSRRHAELLRNLSTLHALFLQFQDMFVAGQPIFVAAESLF